MPAAEEEVKKEEVKEEEEKKPADIAYKVELTSSSVGSNKFSRLPIADKHLIIAKKMERDFADQISQAKVNESTG